uniref:Uncharacterized protein n=1 Tax=Nicotiana tabacum TaxID=4097 RepID=A0A1S3Y0H4_TOBAC|nr:PREDICTED: uncharacterized protein LOC107770658 [Nicotiana tabacum]
MACIQHFCSTTFFLAIIACHQVLFTEGRQYPTPTSLDQNSVVVINSGNNFRTTETGNSPGMGHSSKGPKPNNSKQPKTLIGDTSSTVEGDDREATGHSPGIGHSSHNDKIGPNF